MTYIATANLNEEAQLDAGNRLRVSQLTTLIDAKQIHSLQPLLFDREEIGSATQTYQSGDGATTMTTTTGATDKAIAQTKMFAPYYSGKSQFIEITFDSFGHQGGAVKRAGYFTSTTTTPFAASKDGLWFEGDGTNYSFQIQKNGVEVLNVDQADWNEDVFTGQDFDLFNVMVVQFLYLGGTAVRFGFIKEGFIKWAHTYVHAGEVAGTFIGSPQKPIRYEIIGNGTAASMNMICGQVASEGSVDEVGVTRSYDVGAVHVDANATASTYAVVGIKLKTAYKDVRVDVLGTSILLATNDAAYWSLRLNPTVAGTFTFADETDAALQSAQGATANTVTGGTILASGYLSQQDSTEISLKSALRLGSTIAGVMDEMVLCVQPLSVNLDVYGSLVVQEFI